jgi:hypothetical protein
MTEPARAHNPALGWIVLGGAIALFVGSFLPWASVDTVFGSVSKNGTSGDGVFTLVGAVVVALLTFPAVKQPVARGRSMAAFIVALLAGVICVVDIVDVNRVADEAGAQVNVGAGLWLCAVGAGAAAIAALLLFVGGGRVPQSGPTAPTWTPPPAPPGPPAGPPTGPPTGPPSS